MSSSTTTSVQQPITLTGAIATVSHDVNVSSGVLTMSGVVSGCTIAFNGVLRINDVSALGSSSGGTVVAAGATLQVNAGGSIGEPLTLDGAGASGAGALNDTAPTSVELTGAITLAGDSTVSHDSSATVLELSGPVTGSGGLTKTGGGEMYLWRSAPRRKARPCRPGRRWRCSSSERSRSRSPSWARGRPATRGGV
jgi:hypothetical protein